MASDKKNEKNKAPVIDATSTETAPSMTPAVEPAQVSLIVAPPANPLGVKIPTIEEVEGLELIAAQKLGDVRELLNDPLFTDVERERIKALVEQANPVREGMEEVVTTWTVPRISIAQPTTQSAAKPESAKQGAMYTTAGALLDSSFQFIPLHFNLEHIMFKQGEKAPECFSPDAKLGQPYGVCQKCPHLPFGQQNGGRGEQKKTDCQNQIVVAMLSYDLTQIYLCQFGKTSRGAGSALMSLAKVHPFAWKQSYLLSTEKKTGDLGVYFIYKIEPTGKDNPASVIKIAEAFSRLFSANRKRFLGDYYLKAGSSQQTAALAEAEFDRNKLAAGLSVDDAGEPDLSAPPPASSVRTAAKPM
jgi:hypothetical protein